MDRLRKARGDSPALDPAVRLTYRAMPAALATTVLVATLAVYAGGARGPRTQAAAVAYAVLVSVTTAMARRRRWPLFTAAAVGALLFPPWPAFLAASYYAGAALRAGGRRAVFAAAAAVAVVGIPLLYPPLGIAFLVDPDPAAPAVERVVLGVVLVGLPLQLGLWINARRQVLAGLLEQAARLKREQDVRAEHARSTERARLAREMHDVVAHQVSLMVLHAGALEVDAPDRDTASTAALIGDAGREALRNLRDVLGLLRRPASEFGDVPAALPVLGDLDRLLDQSRAAGLEVRRLDRGVPYSLPLPAEHAAYRIVQEALTNVHKHAAGAVADVDLRYLDDGVEVIVSNRSAGAAPHPPAAGGYGLVGLRERVQLVGGRLKAGPLPGGGYAVHARIPAIRPGGAP